MDLITGLTIATKGYQHAVGKSFHFGWKIAFVLVGVFWLAMLFNCLQRKFKTDIDKIAWVLVLVFVPVVGAFLYLFWMHYGLKKKK
tara:strand:- start:29 stop:286 length:258 start_codon:yes stop_codon:yes gene_type:complete